MLSLITSILFSLIVSFFAFQNANAVTVNLGGYVFVNVPLYLVVVISLLLGIFMAWAISTVNGFSYFMSMRKKDKNLGEVRKKLYNLSNKVRDLEVENAELRNHGKAKIQNNTSKNEIEKPDGNTLYKPSIFERLFPSSKRRYSKSL